jgi:flagellar hook-associated protein 1 FlgK
MPIITTLHTILESPDTDQLRVLQEVVSLSARVVVMSERGIELLKQVYDVPVDKIDFIPHGIPDVPFTDSSLSKEQFGVEGRTVLLTFGLIGPGKGIEHVIEALPEIVMAHPEVVYLVLGATHPHLVAREGERYRLSLEWLAEERGGIVLPLGGGDAFSVVPATVAPGAFHGGAGTLPGVMLNGQDITRRLVGGRFGAAAELRDLTLPRMQAEIDLSAAHTASRFAAQGLRLFTDTASTVPDVTTPHAGSAMLGFAGVIRVNPTVAADPALVRDGTHAVAALPGGPGAFLPNPASGPAGFATLLDRVLGFTFGREAAPGAVHPPIASGALGPDGTLVSTLSGLGTLEAHGGALVAAQAGARAAAEQGHGRAVALSELLAARSQARSGVDVDREVAAMVELQNAYTVNARVVATIQAMWDALFGAVR